VVPLTISAAAFTSVNPHAPMRCTLTLSATALPNGGPADPTPANDTVPLELNVVDLNDVPRAAADGSLITSAAPVRMGIRKGASAARKTIALRVRRADIETATQTEPHTLVVTLADGDCPAGTVGLDTAPDATRALERLVTISGTRTLRVPVTLAVDATAFRAASKRSPARCTARFTASAVTEDVAGGDGDPIVTGAALSNDTTTVVIDVVDFNDF
jgi:hypothetical protein